MAIRRTIRKYARLSVLAVSGLLSCAIAAEKEQSLEYQVKAAFLLNFTKFIEWPAETPAESRFPSASWASDPFAGALDRMVEGERSTAVN